MKKCAIVYNPESGKPKDKKDIKLQFRGSSNQRILNVQETLKTGNVIKEEKYR